MMRRAFSFLCVALLAGSSWGALAISSTNATLVTASSAKLNAYITNVGVSNPACTFYYGTNNASTNAASWQSSTNIGVQAAGLVYRSVSGLTANTNYYFCLFASNSTATAWGGVRTFKTLPAVTGDAAVVEIELSISNATLVTASGATLNAGMTSAGDTNPVCWFHWGLSDGGSVISNWGGTSSVGQQAAGKISTNITGLASNTLYYYRLYASNSTDTAWSGLGSFTTLSSPVSDKGGTISNALYLGGVPPSGYVAKGGTAGQTFVSDGAGDGVWSTPAGGGDVVAAGDLTQFTTLGGTNGQVFVSKGDGTGLWTNQTASGGGGDVSAADLIAATQGVYNQASIDWASADAVAMGLLSNSMVSMIIATNAATSNGIVAWVQAQGYGDLDEATADGLYDALGAAAGASNGVLVQIGTSNFLTEAVADALYDAFGTGVAVSNGVIAQLVSSNWIPHAVGAGVYASSNGAWVALSLSTGDVSKAYTDLADVGTSNGVIAQLVSSNWIPHATGGGVYGSSNGAWVVLSFATGDVSKAYVDLGDTTTSNGVIAQLVSSNWIPHAAGAGVYGSSNGGWALLSLSTGDVSKAYADGVGVNTSNGVVAWAGAQGYSTNGGTVTNSIKWAGESRLGTPATGDLLIYTGSGWTNTAGYVGRSLSGWDYTHSAGLTRDGTYRTLDLSAIVPAGAKAVGVQAFCKDALTGIQLWIMGGGSNTGGLSVMQNITQTANVYIGGTAVVSCSTNRTIQYAVNASMDEVYIAITGWFF
jgi:hypothetical protein